MPQVFTVSMQLTCLGTSSVCFTVSSQLEVHVTVRSCKEVSVKKPSPPADAAGLRTCQRGSESRWEVFPFLIKPNYSWARQPRFPGDFGWHILPGN